jgi:PPOX class probable F420-dependent enzyme
MPWRAPGTCPARPPLRYAARRAPHVPAVPRRAGQTPLNLTEQDARRRFATAAVARLATVTEDGRPHIVPITFAVDGNRIYTAVDAKPKTTVRGLRRLRNIRAHPQVSLIADHYAQEWAALWWVRADGTAAILEDPGQVAAPVALLTARYPQYRDRPPAGPVIAIRVTRWTGWAASAPG